MAGERRLDEVVEAVDLSEVLVGSDWVQGFKLVAVNVQELELLALGKVVDVGEVVV